MKIRVFWSRSNKTLYIALIPTIVVALTISPRKGWLRVCGSCEYVFLRGVGCPKCQWGSYSAIWVYESRWRALWAWLFQRPYRRRRKRKGGG